MSEIAILPTQDGQDEIFDIVADGTWRKYLVSFVAKREAGADIFLCLAGMNLRKSIFIWMIILWMWFKVWLFVFYFVGRDRLEVDI
jgi:hypothetical protein